MMKLDPATKKVLIETLGKIAIAVITTVGPAVLAILLDNRKR